MLLETGARSATYKLALMTAIIDICVEYDPAPDGTLAIPLQEITHRVIALYWNQTRTFGEQGRLRQLKGSGRSLTDAIADIRDRLAARGIKSPEVAREIEDREYLTFARTETLRVSNMPIKHLQTAVKGSHDTDFLYDASEFQREMTRRDVERINHIVLRPGVADGLRHASTLLKTYIRALWTRDVIAINPTELEENKLEHFLFGSDRTGLAALTTPLRELQGNRCFYCDSRLTSSVHIDHVLPWSVIPIDGVANLVAADQRCNLAKRATIPVRDHTERALGRTDLKTIAKLARFPLLHERTRSASIGIYAALPHGSLLWRGRDDYLEHD